MRPQPIPDDTHLANSPEYATGHTPEYANERLELAAILTSRTFERSPALVQLLIYLCSKYFESTADQLKFVDQYSHSPGGLRATGAAGTLISGVEKR